MKRFVIPLAAMLVFLAGSPGHSTGIKAVTGKTSFSCTLQVTVDNEIGQPVANDGIVFVAFKGGNTVYSGTFYTNKLGVAAGTMLVPDLTYEVFAKVTNFSRSNSTSVPIAQGGITMIPSFIDTGAK